MSAAALGARGGRLQHKVAAGCWELGAECLQRTPLKRAQLQLMTIILFTCITTYEKWKQHQSYCHSPWEGCESVLQENKVQVRRVQINTNIFKTSEGLKGEDKKCSCHSFQMKWIIVRACRQIIKQHTWRPHPNLMCLSNNSHHVIIRWCIIRCRRGEKCPSS